MSRHMIIGMAFLSRTCLAVLPVIAPVEAAWAQAGLLTVGAVRSTLVETLASLRDGLNEATYDAKSVGNSLQANIQNVISDIDSNLHNQIEYTFDRLDEQQRRLINDAQKLIALTKGAAEELSAKNFSRAENLMKEADILAYNTSYSLPCRTMRPRIVSIAPETISSRDNSAVIRVRGNFLSQGKDVSINIDGEPAQIRQRTDNEIVFSPSVGILDKAKSVNYHATATISGLSVLERSLGLIRGCVEKITPVEPAPTVFFLIEPPVTYNISGTLQTTHMVDRIFADLEGRFDRTGSDRCEDNFSIDQNYCIVEKSGTFDHIEIWDQSTNCGSAVGPVNPSGDKCVFVGGAIRGCGAKRGPFKTWLECKGRGWAKYNYRLWRKDRVREEAGRTLISKEGIPGESVFSFAFPQAVNDPEYQFEVSVDRLQGGKILERKTLSNATPVAGNWSLDVKDGTLTLAVPN